MRFVRNKKKWIYAGLLVIAGFLAVWQLKPKKAQVSIVPASGAKANLWDYQCIDTVKFSRDSARNWKGNQGQLNSLIDRQLSAIQDLGANCVSLGTPYDEEFVPFLSVWVAKAREKGLKVWFRGNFSGWEGWFNYPKLKDPAQHHRLVYSFVTRHPNLFQNGDIFTPAPEPENGLVGSPFASKSARAAFINFLTTSYANCQNAFKQINKTVACGYFSVNGDVAKDILTPQMVKNTGNVVVVDHYVENSERMDLDIKYFHDLYGSKVALGEFGAPIPDINGPMDDAAQAQFIRQLLQVLYKNKNIISAVNYWVLNGGTTALYKEDGSAKPAADAIRDYYKPAVIYGKVTDAFDNPLPDVAVSTADGINSAKTDKQGEFKFAIPANTSIRLVAGGGDYAPLTQELSLRQDNLSYALFKLDPKFPSIGYLIKRLVLTGK